MSNCDPVRIGSVDAPPNQNAINAALELYVHGREWSKLSQTRSGWSVLRQATSPQMRCAMELMQESHQLSDAQMHAALVQVTKP
jgi:hypothetical protein